jgi:hypothetical protein
LPEVGLNETIVGVGTVTVKLVALVAVPPAVVTLIGPVVAPAGTGATICVAAWEVTTADTPLNLTEVGLSRFAPVIVTEVPTGPEVGKNEVIVGSAATVKFAALVAVPAAVVTLIGPVVAVTGTVVAMVVDVLVPMTAATPLNLTEVAPARFVPVIVTGVPASPEVGVNEVIVGRSAGSVNVPPVPVPAAVVTVTGPVVARSGTAVVICTDVFVRMEAATPLNLTKVAPPRFVPLIVTGVPTGPEVGVKVKAGSGGGPAPTVKLVALSAVGATSVVTWILPVVAPTGTRVLM